MRIRRSLCLCFILLTALSTLARAQDTRKVGITMAAPQSFGVLWHAGKKVAIRPELSFGGSSASTLSSSLDIDGSGWNIGTGVSAIFYVGTYDHLRTYISPRFTYGHASSTSSSSSLATVTTSELKTTTNAVGGAGSFGAQYALGDRFGIFGEVGFGVTHSDSKSSLAPTTGSGTVWGTRGSVGVVFYP
jgi:hypothetical protein